MDEVVKQVLRVAGLDSYSGCFETHAIDGATLSDLTSQDLEKMGMNALGHRVKLLKVIRAVAGGNSVDRPYKFLGHHYFHPKQLAAALSRFWDEGVRRIDRRSVLEWVRTELRDEDLVIQLEDISDDEDLNSGQKLAISLLALDPESSLSWRGELITPAWLAAHPREGLALYEGSAGIWLQRLRNDKWLQERSIQYKALISEVRSLSVPLDFEKVAVCLLESSEKVGDKARQLKESYVGSSHPVLDGIFQRKEISYAESIVVLSSDRSLFLTVPQTKGEEGMRVLRGMEFEFDEDAARNFLEREDWAAIRPLWEEKRRNFAVSSNDQLGKLFGSDSPGFLEAVAIVTASEKYFWSVNSLGMPFVRIRGLDVRFCVWPIRVQDYEVFIRSGGRIWKAPDFGQTQDHPAVKVSWNDATEFCLWLTAEERMKGLIGPSEYYRLPTDLEWSAAAGLPREPGDTPRARHRSIKGHYPWGKVWPPPKESGNYSPSLEVDQFEYTSPVGNFAPNLHGLYDLGGNVWEWCEDSFDGQNGHQSSGGPLRVLRGASWFYGVEDYLLSSFRNRSDPLYNNGNIGFRCVLVTS